jgi:hypothetical protein
MKNFLIEKIILTFTFISFICIMIVLVLAIQLFIIIRERQMHHGDFRPMPIDSVV